MQILTGATGSLGAQLIASLLVKRSENWKIVCLVRAEDDSSAHQRVLKTLQKHQLTLNDTQVSRLSCLAAKLPESHLGLSPQAYENLTHGARLVIHAAWPVHFGAGLQSFVPHLQGLHNLIQLARMNKAKLLFCSSTSSVLAGPSRHIEERIYRDPKDAVAIGYARSKFVAESICASAWEAGGQGQIGVLRLGQLSGDTQFGIWKTEEGWPQLLASADLVGCLPDLDEVCQIPRHCKTGPNFDTKLACPDSQLASHGQSSASYYRHRDLSFGQAGKFTGLPRHFNLPLHHISRRSLRREKGRPAIRNSLTCDVAREIARSTRRRQAAFLPDIAPNMAEERESGGLPNSMSFLTCFCLMIRSMAPQARKHRKTS